MILDIADPAYNAEEVFNHFMHYNLEWSINKPYNFNCITAWTEDISGNINIALAEQHHQLWLEAGWIKKCVEHNGRTLQQVHFTVTKKGAGLAGLLEQFKEFSEGA